MYCVLCIAESRDWNPSFCLPSLPVKLGFGCDSDAKLASERISQPFQRHLLASLDKIKEHLRFDTGCMYLFGLFENNISSLGTSYHRKALYNP